MYTYKIRYRKVPYAIWSIDKESMHIDPYEVSKEMNDKDIISLQLLGVPHTEIFYPHAKSVSKDKIIQQKLWRKYLVQVPEDENLQQWIRDHDKTYWIISNGKTLEPFYESCILINEEGGQFELRNNKICPRQTA